MSSSRSLSTSSLAGGVREVRVVNWPLRDDGLRCWLLALLPFGAAALVHFLTRSWLLAGLSLAALLVSLWRLWVPVAFELGPRGVTQVACGLRFRTPWREFVRYRLHTRGIVLLVDPDERPLEAFRGMFIRWGGQRDEVLAVVERFIGRRGRLYDSTVATRRIKSEE